MNEHEHDLDPVVESALANAPRELPPSSGFTDRTIGALRAGGLVHAEPSPFRRPLIAAAWFIAGVGFGAVATELLRSTSGIDSPVIASIDPATLPDYVEWY